MFDQGIIQDTLQDTTQVLVNIEVPSIEQTQQPQEVPLKRSARKRRYVISDHYIVYLVEQEDLMGKTPDDYFTYLMEQEKFDMKDCSPGDTSVVKEDKFSVKQCPKTDLEIKKMQNISYSSTIGSLMYDQVCTHLDIAFIVGLLGRYLSDPGLDHWKATKPYLQRAKDFMLTYRRSDSLEIVGYSDFDFAGCLDSKRSTSGYVYMLASEAISWKILFSNNNRISVKEKHIDIKNLSLKEKVLNSQIFIEHIRINSMLTDPLINGPPHKVFHEHTTRMSVVIFCNTLV
ncbi:LOW QUALITY PROTEIN: hypothetical protein V2J09_000734 [Rumex salicifolius]